MTTYEHGRDAYYDDLHKANLKTFNELAKRVTRRFLSILSIQIDEPQFGNIRVVIFLKEKK